MSRSIMTTLSMLLSALLASAAASSATSSGLHGIVKKGPIKPVCETGQPCDAPAQVTLLFTRTTATGIWHYTEHSSELTGAYRIALPSGYYTVTTKERIGITRNIRPHRVLVRRRHWDKLDFFIDTGIR